MDWLDPDTKAVLGVGFPTVEQLRRGILLDCITSAFWLVGHEPLFYKYWEDETFFADEIQGEWWAVTFTAGGQSRPEGRA